MLTANKHSLNRVWKDKQLMHAFQAYILKYRIQWPGFSSKQNGYLAVVLWTRKKQKRKHSF